VFIKEAGWHCCVIKEKRKNKAGSENNCPQ
jgi:hypothetical protein